MMFTVAVVRYSQYVNHKHTEKHHQAGYCTNSYCILMVHQPKGKYVFCRQNIMGSFDLCSKL